MYQCNSHRFFGFLSAGGLATLLHWAVMTLLVLAGMQPLAATLAGSLTGALSNYGLQRQLAFHQAGQHRKTFWRYCLSCVFSWCCNLAFFFLLHHLLLLPMIFAQLVTTGVVAVLNYVVYQRLVFHEQNT